MKKVMLIICILLIAAPAHAGSWDETNTKLHVPLMLLMLVDYRQTKYNSKQFYQHGGLYIKDGIVRQHTESNFFLGKAPKPHKVDQYFGYAAIALTGIIFATPPKVSYHIQGAVISIEGYVTVDNYMLGAKVEF